MGLADRLDANDQRLRGVNTANQGQPKPTKKEPSFEEKSAALRDQRRQALLDTYSPIMRILKVNEQLAEARKTWGNGSISDLSIHEKKEIRI